MKNNAAEMALIIPPINEKTDDIFDTALVYLMELSDLIKKRLAYLPFLSLWKGWLIEVDSTIKPFSDLTSSKGQILTSV